MSQIQQLLDVWGERPPRVEPDDLDHLSYVFGRLLPALRDAIPEIEASQRVQLQEQRATPPSMEIMTMLEQASNNRSPDPTPSTAGTGAASDHTAGTSDTPASVVATSPLKLASLKSAASKHGRRGAPRRRTAVLPGQQQGTGGGDSV